MKENLISFGLGCVVFCAVVGAVTMVNLSLHAVVAFTTEEEVVEEVTPPIEFEVLLVGNEYNRRTRTVKLGVLTLPATILVEEEHLPVLMQGSTWGIMTPREVE